jgi:adenylyltransferase/sulfurtransferase
MAEEYPFEISCEELHARLESGEKIVVVDVRQPEEYAICKLAGSTLIPMNDVPARLGELDPEQEIVVHCKMGGRAGQVTGFLRQQGFSKARNLSGGILAWADKYEPTMTRY